MASGTVSESWHGKHSQAFPLSPEKLKTVETKQVSIYLTNIAVNSFIILLHQHIQVICFQIGALWRDSFLIIIFSS